jgi:hypothetical protein
MVRVRQRRSRCWMARTRWAVPSRKANAPTASLSAGQANRLAVVLDALDGVPLSDGERASLTWLALSGFEMRTVEDIAVVITRARRSVRARQWPSRRTPFAEVHRPGGWLSGASAGAIYLGEGVVLGGA